MQVVAMLLALTPTSAMSRMRDCKRRFDLKTCQIHHVLPRQAFQVHKHNLSRIDSESSKNLMFMPSGQSRVDTLRPIHDGGHMPYNHYVMQQVARCETDEDVSELQFQLRQRLRSGDPSLPWK